MGAEFIHQPVAALAVAEGDQPFAQQLDPDRRAVILWQLARKKRRDPVLAKHLAHRGTRVGLRQQFVDFLAQHGLSPLLSGGRGRPYPFATAASESGGRSGFSAS